MAATIETLAHALDNAPDYSVGTLERILLENLPSPEEVVALADTSMPYGRTILRLNDKYEMIIGCWPRNGWCDAHDHGDAEGVVYGCSGEVEHFVPPPKLAVLAPPTTIDIRRHLVDRLLTSFPQRLPYSVSANERL